MYARRNLSIIEPKKYEKATSDHAWKKAMDVEIEMIVKNQTWSWLTDQQINKFIGVKWGFKTKLNLDDTIQNHKARLVTKGYS